MTSWVYEKNKRYSHRATLCFQPACASRVCHKVPQESFYTDRQIKAWAKNLHVEDSLLDTIREAATAPPADYLHHQGWVLTAFRNAL